MEGVRLRRVSINRGSTEFTVIGLADGEMLYKDKSSAIFTNEKLVRERMDVNFQLT